MGLNADGIVGPNTYNALGLKKQTSNVANVNKTSQHIRVENSRNEKRRIFLWS
ncbi:hypothetical protein MRBL20_003689 [Peribacillus frigoritolerans]